jgi:uncharacterized membrane protein YphA (DoxX/SURF4 family)
LDAVTFVASVVVGVVFVVAGAAKVARGREWPQQARDLGAPAFVVPMVPWIELVVGAALVVQLFAPWPAIGASFVLIVFTALILGQLARGRHPQCACFGAWSAAPLGARHVARNAVLLAVALVAAIGAAISS